MRPSQTAGEPMQRVLNILRDNAWLRLGVLLSIVLVGAWHFLPSDVKLLVFRYAGVPTLGALALGLATLWVTYKIKPALWVFGAVFVLAALSVSWRVWSLLPMAYYAALPLLLGLGLGMGAVWASDNEKPALWIGSVIFVLMSFVVYATAP